MDATDQVLLQKWVQTRDAEAFRTIAMRHAAMVYNTSRRILRNPNDAEEVAQECFGALVRAGDKPGAYLGAWLHRVATNLSFNRVEAGRRRQAREDRFAENAAPVTDPHNEDLYAHVDKAIAALPDKLRLPLVAHYLENQTHEAIAASIGVSRQTVTYRIGQGVERVRADLKRKGVMVTAGGLSAFLLANRSEAVPAALAAGLGKLAVAGVPTAAAGIGMAGISGLLSLKGVLAAVAIIALGAAGTVALRPGLTVDSPANAPTTTASASAETAAVEPAAPAEPGHTKSADPAALLPAFAPVSTPATGTAPTTPAAQAEPKDRRADIERTLTLPVSIEFENIRLAEVLAFFSDSYDLNIALDPRVVAPGAPPDVAPDYVTDGHVPYVDVRNVSLGQALRTLCRPLGLDFAVNNGVITVSSPALLDADGFARLNDADDSSSELLQTETSLVFDDVHLSEILEFAAESLDVNITVDHRAVVPGGERIPQGQPEPPFVTTGHVPYINLKNVSLSQGLDSMLRPMNLSYSVEDGFLWISSPELIEQEAFTAPDLSHAEPALAAALQAPNDLEFDATPLSEALAAMAQRAGVSIEVDATNAAAIAAAVVNDYAVKDLPFSTALGIILREHDLAFAASGENIIVTSPAAAHANSPAQLSVVPVQQLVKH